jgi:hypothetical protein
MVFIIITRFRQAAFIVGTFIRALMKRATSGD